MHQLGDALGVQGTFAKEHLVKGHPKRPHICLGFVALVSEYLWGHIYWRSHHRLADLVLIFQGLAKAKVADLNLVLVKHYIRGLNVSMKNIILVQETKRTKKLREVFKGLLLQNETLFIYQGL